MEASLCGSAESGLALYRSIGADLIVLDINLPGMDGFELLQSLRRESTVPVIIVSARESDEDIVLGLGIGADEFVTKPFVPRVPDGAHQRHAQEKCVDEAPDDLLRFVCPRL